MKPIFSAILIVLTVISLIAFLHYFRKALNQLEANHSKEYEKLVNKDRLIETAGSWVRWPVGSAFPLLSIFIPSHNYGDEHLRKTKIIASLCFFVFLSCLIFTFFLLM